MTVSKAIRQEFLAVLFGKAVFVLQNIVEPIIMATWKRKQIPFIDQVLNVCYLVSLFPPSDMRDDKFSRMLRDSHNANIFMSERSAKPIEFIMGTEVLRNSCSIELDSATIRVMPLLQSPLFMAIKGLTGFKVVTLKLTTPRSWRWSQDKVLMVNGGHQSDADYIEEFRGMANAFCSALEPSLGPSLISEDCDEGLTWELTFRPQEYVANRNKVEAMSSKSGDEGNESFPQVGSS